MFVAASTQCCRFTCNSLFSDVSAIRSTLRILEWWDEISENSMKNSCWCVNLNHSHRIVTSLLSNGIVSMSICVRNTPYLYSTSWQSIIMYFRRTATLDLHKSRTESTFFLLLKTRRLSLQVILGLLEDVLECFASLVLPTMIIAHSRRRSMYLFHVQLNLFPLFSFAAQRELAASVRKWYCLFQLASFTQFHHHSNLASKDWELMSQFMHFWSAEEIHSLSIWADWCWIEW